MRLKKHEFTMNCPAIATFQHRPLSLHRPLNVPKGGSDGRFKAKEKYRRMFEIQKSGDKTSSGEICLDIKTHASPKVGQDQVSEGVRVLCWHAAPVAYVLLQPFGLNSEVLNRFSSRKLVAYHFYCPRFDI